VIQTTVTSGARSWPTNIASKTARRAVPRVSREKTG